MGKIDDRKSKNFLSQRYSLINGGHCMKRQNTLLKKSLLAMLMLVVLLNGLSVKRVDAYNPIRIASDSGSIKAEDFLDLDKVDFISNSTNEVSFEIEIPWQQLTLIPKTVDGKNYTEVSLEGWAKTTQAGSPELPILVKQVGVPFGVSLDISILPGKAHTYDLDHPVLPVVTQEVDWQFIPDEAEAPTATNSFVYKEDAEIYQGKESYPVSLAEITSDGIMRQQRIASVTIYPTQYQPAGQQLTIYETMQVTVKFIGTAITSEESYPEESAEIEKYLEANLVNYEESQQMRVSDVQLLDQPELSQEISVLPWTPPAPGWPRGPSRRRAG